MNKIIFLAGVLFLGNVNGMDGMDSCSSAVSCPQENRHSDIEKCMIVCDALSEANSELHNKFESSEKS
ncbi:MAG: hypothetical protein LBB21_05950, partial [Holosporaceae bacterium]|nr:hypothetical protein [Holosporaceae bacterium]